MKEPEKGRVITGETLGFNYGTRNDPNGNLLKREDFPEADKIRVPKVEPLAKENSTKLEQK